ncbi:MAG: GNAT family N-acetyltransferase [Saccharospirillaceae bacterium]|nr:GNAT family N-acetyltransferase [Pseudomonadales bacterium]NRB78494.1 GNAT family N-acetyltransferase [Saccharospirillaceae bacterium]
MAINQITIRAANPSDFETLELINQTSSNTPYQSFALTNAIEKQSCFLAINSDNKIMGWIAIQKGFELIDILYITTANEFKRRGVSKSLFNYVRKEFKNSEIMLEVRKSNLKAIKLYESLHMVFLNTRKKYYQNPNEDALVYKYYI